MLLQQLELTNFKNYEYSEIHFDGQFICFTGRNGQGKSNLLDAIHYLSMTKSFLNFTDTSNIRHGEDFFRIAGRFVKDDESEHNVVCIQERNDRKRILVDDKLTERFATHIGEFPVVVISPSDFDLLYSSDDRRKFIDSTISQYDKIYLDNLLQYNRTLTQRNKLLKNIYHNSELNDMIVSYDMKLSEFGTPIHRSRKEFLEDFVSYIQYFYNLIVKTDEKISMTYDSELSDNSFISILEGCRKKDIASGFTTTGIHREDITMYLDTFPIRKYGSQGQQKSFLIALKLAKHKYLSLKKNNTPLLLIDDLHDKLDSSRVENLFHLLSEENFSQVFITDTQKERLTPLMKNIASISGFFDISKGTAINL